MQHPQNRQTKTALITGATGGLGIELCQEFARHGFDLVVTARDPRRLWRLSARLREMYGIQVALVVLDLNQPDAPRLLYRKVREAGLSVDVLVNNAGFGLGGKFGDNLPRLQDAMLRVNVQAPTRLCRLFLPGMLARGRGGILNVCSIASYVAGPNNAVYCASKAYLLSLTEALADELRDTPIRVTAVCPGAMHTGFAGRADMEDTSLFRFGVMNPRTVARRAYRAFAQGKTQTVPGALNRGMITLARFVPRCFSTRLSGLIQQPF